MRDGVQNRQLRRLCRHLLCCSIITIICTWRTAPVTAAPHIGYLYKLEGHLNGQPVIYIGSAASLKERLTKRHKWDKLLKQKTTKVSFKKVYAELDIAASNQKTLYSAREEALRSVEQKDLDKARKRAVAETRKRRPGQKRTKILNKIKAAKDPYAWQTRHKVTVSHRWTVVRKPGAPLILRGVGGVLLIAEVIRLYYDAKRSRFVMAPYLLEDEHGVFTIDYKRRSWLASTVYFKNYISTASKGKRIQISRAEFSALSTEARALWGTLDKRGKFVPGLLRPSLDVIVERA